MRERQIARVRKQKDIVHRLSLILCALILFWFSAHAILAAVSAEVSEFLSPRPVQVISYKAGSGDTLWMIAANAVDQDEDIREKIIAIRKFNGLTPNQALQPGQIIQVPMKTTCDKDFRYTFKLPVQ